MYCLDLFVLNLECLQEEFRHVYCLCFGGLARDLGYDRSQELPPNYLRLDRLIEGARGHLHLGYE